MEEISSFLWLMCVSTSRTADFRMKTELRVVTCASATLGPLRVDQQPGSPCCGTITYLRITTWAHMLNVG
jgi:hypothetical protein